MFKRDNAFDLFLYGFDITTIVGGADISQYQSLSNLKIVTLGTFFSDMKLDCPTFRRNDNLVMRKSQL